MPEQEPNITPEQTEQKIKIAEIEKLNIGPSQKADIILVVLGMKPATELDLYKYNDKTQIVEQILQQVGLAANLKKMERPQKNLIAKLAIAQDQDTLEKLMTLDPNKDHAEYGALMGYPDSAVEAFLDKEKLLDESDYPDMAGIIFPMKLSKENWQQEVEQLRKWSQAIQEYAPDLYNELKGK